ncbi:hypothetical protein BDY24DRAFT_131367 [Mrakia frigida]|uniref:exosome nuclease subunit RRP6 n=1 Tax=Mrakia frigida TaxID=29902 RepID=UPI003FCC18D6
MPPRASPHSPTSPTYLSSLQTHLKATTTLAHSLPKPSDIAFHRSVDAKLATRLDEASGRVWGVLEGLLGLVEGLREDGGGGAGGGMKKRKREEEGLVDEFERDVGEGIDTLLERADTCLDNFLGKLPPPSIPIIPTETARSKNSSINLNGPPSTARLPTSITNASIPKPQLLFDPPTDPVDLSSVYKTYSSTLTPSFVKHHSQVPLDYVYPPYEAPLSPPPPSTDGSSTLAPNSKGPPPPPPHPYTYELAHIPYPSSLLAPVPTTPTPPASFEEVPFTYITTLAGLRELIARLETETHVAIDLEHHSFRTYGGFLCLMQVSTRGKGGKGSEDWVVDLVVPEVRSGMSEFGKVLADPRIVKIFHGAESDIIWLQQDFDLYVVNLFDTYHASKALEFPSHSLASLLSLYCDFTPDKRYQIADWRIRPLPLEMLHYARSDTHYLLYIYDSLLNALISRSSPRSSPTPPDGSSSSSSSSSSSIATPTPLTTPHLLRTVLQRSEDTCRRRYSRELYDSLDGSGPQGYRLLAKKWGKLGMLENPPFGSAARLEGFVFRRVHEWRDHVARKEDESTRWVLPNHQIFTLAGARPTSWKALGRVLQPMTAAVRERGEELCEVVRKAVEEAEGESGSGGGREVVMEEREKEQEIEVGGSKKPTEIVLGVWDMLSTLSSTETPTPTPTPTSSIAKKSSLFGSTLVSSKTTLLDAPPAPAPAPAAFIATKSSLFGSPSTSIPRPAVSAAASTVVQPSSSSTRSSGFLAARKRINLSINPPPPPPQAPQPDLSAPEQIPFVPASARLLPSTSSSSSTTTTTTPVVAPTTKVNPIPKKDEVVTVGQPRIKKRKRDKKALVAEGAEEAMDVDEVAEQSSVSKGKGKAAVEEVDADADDVEDSLVGVEQGGEKKKFDYATAPNGLDPVKGGAGAAAALSKSIKVKKTRKPKTPYVEFGDFKKPPMSMAETKKGNKSMTFHS